MLLYLVSVAILLYSYQIGVNINHGMPDNLIDMLYSVNIFLALSFCLLLVAHFSSFNKTINEKLATSNIELQKKKFLLESEIVERKNTEIKLHTLLNDKEILLSETHHRVKNNLAVVSGMLDLQVLMTDEEKIKTILADSRSRIKSMSLIHESLYRFDNVSQIEFGRYIRTLCEEIKNANKFLSSSINIIYDLEEIYLNVTKSIPCGLLINEVVTNSFKHAFPSQSGEIRIIFKKKEDFCLLEISDNGTGMHAGNDETSLSIGMTLIDAFVNQLDGKHEFFNSNGTRIKLVFAS
jgi:two-component sensor histidine kinase